MQVHKETNCVYKDPNKLSSKESASIGLPLIICNCLYNIDLKNRHVLFSTSHYRFEELYTILRLKLILHVHYPVLHLVHLIFLLLLFLLLYNFCVVRIEFVLLLLYLFDNFFDTFRITELIDYILLVIS